MVNVFHPFLMVKYIGKNSSTMVKRRCRAHGNPSLSLQSESNETHGYINPSENGLMTVPGLILSNEPAHSWSSLPFYPNKNISWNSEVYCLPLVNVLKVMLCCRHSPRLSAWLRGSGVSKTALEDCPVQKTLPSKTRSTWHGNQPANSSN